ncbi:MAG: hypothetical protein RIM84_23490 [Alphaproteobacteria bacterium]
MQLAAFNAELNGPRQVLVRYRTSPSPIREILAAVQVGGPEIADVNTREGDLENIFRKRTSG